MVLEHCALLVGLWAQLTFSRTRAKTGQIFCVTAGTHIEIVDDLYGHKIIRHQCD